MRIVVDTNIAISAIINVNSRIARIIILPRTKLHFYSSVKLLAEIEFHKQKIRKYTGYSEMELNRIISLIISRIRFVNPVIISKTIIEQSEKLTSDIDLDDAEFVAITDHIKGKLWSGDKKLRMGMILKKWNKFITTEELFYSIIK